MREVAIWKNFGASVALVVVALSTSGYIGPGVGMGAIAFLIAIALGVILLFVGFFWYPIKRLVRSRRDSEASEEDSAA